MQNVCLVKIAETGYVLKLFLEELDLRSGQTTAFKSTKGPCLSKILMLTITV